MKFNIFLIYLMLLSILFSGCSQPDPVPVGEEFGEIYVLGEPVQELVAREPMVKQINNGQMNIYPVAAYSLAGVVKSKKSYGSGWQGEVAPVDLAIVWGKLTLSEYDKYISYRQSNRWYYYRYEAGFPDSKSYIIEHSSNNHILPANFNILEAVKSLKKEQKVLLEGYLVKITAKYNGGNFWWNSSLSRADTGDGSCEVFYVNRVRIDTKVYE